MPDLFKRPVAAGWYAAAAITLLLSSVPAWFLANLYARVTLLVLSVICFFGAAFEWWMRPRLRPAPSSQSRFEDNVSVDFSESVADIRVLDRTLNRYAVAHDIKITNRGSHAISLNASFLVQWTNRTFFCVAPAHESAIPRWDDVLGAFCFTAKRQLMFPLRIDPGTTISGHVFFDVRDAGMAVDSYLSDAVGGLNDGWEHERERNYGIVLRDELTLREKQIDVRRVYAPRLDGSGISDMTDFAVADERLLSIYCPKRESSADGALRWSPFGQSSDPRRDRTRPRDPLQHRHDLDRAVALDEQRNARRRCCRGRRIRASR